MTAETASIYSHPLRLSDRSERKAIPVDIAPPPEALAAIAAALGLSRLRKLRLQGTLSPAGGRDWQLDATLGATVTQPCVVSLAPVTTRIDTAVTRRWLAALAEDRPQPGERQMPEDETAEPLAPVINLGGVLVEALALALPDYPRAADAEPAAHEARPPGAAPLEAEAAKPFAALRALRDRLDGDGDDDGNGGGDGSGGTD